MTVSLHLTDETAARLCEALGRSDLDRAALEALLVEAYRLGRISIGLLAETLGMGVIEADQWLGERGIPLSYSSDDLQTDRDTLGRLVPGAR